MDSCRDPKYFKRNTNGKIEGMERRSIPPLLVSTTTDQRSQRKKSTRTRQRKTSSRRAHYREKIGKTKMTDNDDDQYKMIKRLLGSLDIQRKAFEAEAEGITSELTTKPSPETEPMGIDTPLVDREGYPRADIDVYRARTLRHRLAELRTDHSGLMKQIEHNLLLLNSLSSSSSAACNPQQVPQRQQQDKEEHEARMKPKPKPKYDPKTGKWLVHNWDGTVFGSKPKKKETTSITTPSSSAPRPPSATITTTNTTVSSATSSNNNNQENNNDKEKIPFAKIDSVARDSPAEKAGLQENDCILRFGNIEKTDAMSSSGALFQQVAQLVPAAASENKAISILVSRQEQQEEKVLQVSLTPRPWNGRGLIGCHIIPM